MLYDVFARDESGDWVFITEIEADTHDEAIRFTARYLDLKGTVEYRSYEKDHSQMETLTRKVIVTYEA